MGDRKSLLTKVCTVIFTYEDGSKVRSLCSANEAIVKECGIFWKPGFLYDLEAKKPIPPHMFDNSADIYEEGEVTPSLDILDEHLQEFIKNTWPY